MRGSKVVEECKALGTDAMMVKCDIAKEEDVKHMVDATIDKFEKVDILVNNAAGFDMTPFTKSTKKIWDRIINVDQIGTMNCCKAVLEHMVPQKSGRIISIGSDAGRMGDRFQPTYSASKAAIIGLSKSIAQEVGRYGITVNVVCPSLVRTEENKEGLLQFFGGSEDLMKKAEKSYPTGRFANSEDIADVVVFLASERAGDITGQVQSVNGGLYMLD